jgi:hypothetical protein
VNVVVTVPSIQQRFIFDAKQYRVAFLDKVTSEILSELVWQKTSKKLT